MLEWILILLAVAAVAGLLGFGKLSGLALSGAKLLILVVLVLFLLVLFEIIAIATYFDSEKAVSTLRVW